MDTNKNKKDSSIQEIADSIKGKNNPRETKKENSGKTEAKKEVFPAEETGKKAIEKEREEEIEKMIGLLKKDDDELLKKDRLTEKVNKLVEETEKELGQIRFTGIKPEKEKKKESPLNYLKKLVKKKS